MVLIPSFDYKVPANSHSKKNLARKNEPVETHDKRKDGKLAVKTVTDKKQLTRRMLPQKRTAAIDKEIYTTSPFTMNLKYS